MTVLSAAQSAGIRLMGVKPANLFSTTSDEFALELADLATDVAIEISKAHDWQRIKVLKTIDGDASSIAFDLPDDYGRMLKKGKVHSKNWQTATFRKARDEDEWVYLQDVGLTATPGVWIILSGKMQIYPPMPVGETARFYYISNKLMAEGTKQAFTADTDTFVLSERLLTLGLIWRWRSQKRMEYAEDMANYQIAVAEEIANDKGSNIITVGRHRVRGDAQIAYPGVLGH